MSSSKKKIGGEYGDVRANIDSDKLNAYLVAHVPAVIAPVDIKQFKVRHCHLSGFTLVLTRGFSAVWPGEFGLGSREFGVSKELARSASSRTPHTS